MYKYQMIYYRGTLVIEQKPDALTDMGKNLMPRLISLPTIWIRS
jgi:hypothetical protein